MTERRFVLIGVTTGIVSLWLLGAPSSSNNVNGVIEGQTRGEKAVPLRKIQIEVESGGSEKASTESWQAGTFSFHLDTSNPVFRLIVWDSDNRWWGRDISHIPNDAAHANLPAIVLKPQISRPSPEETREQNDIITWLRKHNPLSAGLMELHMGAFDTPGQPARTIVAGAGGSVHYPEYAASAAAYQGEHPDVTINYQAIGSGKGISQISSGTTDFGMTERRIAASGRGTPRIPVEQVPVGLKATVVIYNSRGLPQDLRFSGPVLAKSFSGQLKSWNEPDLKKINPNADLPSIPITVVTRADASSATDTLSRYLAYGSPEWKDRIGVGASLSWPTGKSALRDAGVAGLVGEVEGAIGYVDLGRVDTPSIQTALVQNLAGRFVAASATSIASGYRDTRRVADLPDTSVGSKDPEAYPMASAEWMLLALPGNDPKKELFLLDFARFFLTNHSPGETEGGLVPLPPLLLRVANEDLNRAAAQILERGDARKRRPQ